MLPQLLFCVAGIYTFYLSYGLYQEKIFKFRDANNQRFTATFFLLSLQCFSNGTFAYIATCLTKQPVNTKLGARPFALTAATYLGAMLFSNEALKHVNYPTQALGKSCKMIPVMLMGVLINKRQYQMKEYATVLCITIGIFIFQYGKQQSADKAVTGEKENSMIGIALLGLSLLLDGITGPKQEELKRNFRPSVHQQMFFTNLWAFAYTLCCALLTGQAMEGVFYIIANPELWGPLLGFSICSALGQNFIFYTIQNFSALACTTITTTRKFFTILASVVMYGHVLSPVSWVGVLLVFLGLGVDLTGKYQKHKTR